MEYNPVLSSGDFKAEYGQLKIWIYGYVQQQFANRLARDVTQ